MNEGLSANEVLTDINDSIRYTVEAPAESYSQTVDWDHYPLNAGATPGSIVSYDNATAFIRDLAVGAAPGGGR